MSEFQDKLTAIIDEYRSGKCEESFSKLIESLKGHDVVLFGAAWIGDFFYDKLQNSGIQVKCFCDNFAVGVTPAGNGPIIKITDLKKLYPRAKIIISCDRSDNIIYNQLLNNGFSRDQIIIRPKALLRVYTLDKLKKHFSGYEWAYNFFHDAASKELILERIKCYLLGTSVEKSLSPQYFEDGLIKFSENEVFVDGGFFIGDTAKEFIHQTGGKYKKIYGFEPDVYCRDRAKEILNGYENIEIIPAGLSSKKGVLRFATTGGTSQASGGNIVENDGDNVTQIPVISLDEFFCEKGREIPTYIKMDIEGSEHEALLGSKKIISEYKPKLAICVYHKPEDIYDLTKLVYEFNPEYKFYLRHYSNYFWESVLYAL